MYCVYGIMAAAAYSFLYFSFFFLSSFQTSKLFVTLFSGNVRPRRLNLGKHVASVGMYRIYQNHAASIVVPLFFSFFILSNFQALKLFV